MPEIDGGNSLTEYRIFETDQFQKGCARLKAPHQTRLSQKLKEYVYPQLRRELHYGKNIKKLRDWSPETWRYRIGNYRLFYEINEEEHIVFLIAFEKRSRAYKRF